MTDNHPLSPKAMDSSKEDRDRGYDTAVQISTASGQVLVAVGTGGIASALSKGGTVARTASGVIIAYDAAGNAVGVVQGIHDAARNGVSMSNAERKWPAGCWDLGRMAFEHDIEVRLRYQETDGQ